MKIILASQSPRRKQLLEWAEVRFDVVTADIVEEFPPDLNADDVAKHIALNKAIAVRNKVKGNYPILAADTIVVIDKQILGKPKDRIEAIEMLVALSGRTHFVITGVAILHQGRQHVFSDTTEVTFHTLTNDQIAYYVDKYTPYDKAGGYAIQEWIGVIGIKSIRGDFYNVMGLPVSRVVQEINNLPGFFYD